MNRYKMITIFFRGLLLSVTIGLFVLVIYPMLDFMNSPSIPVGIQMSSVENTTGLDWALIHNKVEPKPWKSDEILFTNQARSFNDDFMSSINDNTFVGEMLFSQFGGDIRKKEYLEDLIGAKYLGFNGKSFRDLSDRDEVPENIIENYERIHGKPWKYYGEGIIIFNDETVLVLQEGEDYRGSMLLKDSEAFYPYKGYFEVLSSDEEAAAYYEIPLTSIGMDRLQGVGVKSVFPAQFSVSYKVYDGYYFAGDFSNIHVSVPAAYSAMPAIMANKFVYDNNANEALYWKWYYPKLEEILFENRSTRVTPFEDIINANLFSIEGQKVYIHQENEKKEFFMKGVNLGAALPGKTFTEFPMDKDVYLKWLYQMEDLNINTLRVYTLLPPVFYEAFYEYNQISENPIYLLQEIWPEEYPEDHNYLGKEYNETFHQEIEYMVHALHGNINIPYRKFRAYGIYKYDISDYLIGYLVGREMEPEEVKATDEINVGYTYNGQYLYARKGATPTEAWLASGCDYTLKIEDIFYSDAPLVAIVSWPTLDPKEHDSEWNASGDKSKLYNDSVVVDINNIGVYETVSGFFGAYHIYPNYPDFMNNELAYDSYHDDQGRFRYGGYLKEFMKDHTKYPAVVAEYGISTSMATAHKSPDGYDHGGLSERTQADGIIRMTDAIIREGYSGAIIFEWMDEWAKKTWTTEPYMIPYDNNPFWHNALDPEQNYGVLAIEAVEPIMHSSGPIAVGQNSTYLYIEVDEEKMFEELGENKPFIITLDTISGNGVDEFVLQVGPVSKLKVNPGYNWLKGKYMPVDMPLETYETDYEELVQVINKENISKQGDITPEKSTNLSALKYGGFEDPRNAVMYKDGKWIVRIPYGLLGISDPVSKQALLDPDFKIPVLRDKIETTSIDQIAVGVYGSDIKSEFSLSAWDTPEYESRKKLGFDVIADYFKSLD